MCHRCRICFWLWQLAVGTWCGGTVGVVLWCHTCHGGMSSPFGGIDDSQLCNEGAFQSPIN